MFFCKDCHVSIQPTASALVNRNYICKLCAAKRRTVRREYQRKWYERNKVKCALYRKEKMREYSILAEYKQKTKAHNAVKHAIRAGNLTRPMTCSYCESEAFIEAHHPDYTKVLEVVWVCRSCHEDIHHGTRT